MTGNFDRKLRLPRINFRGFFTRRKYVTWDKRLYFPSEGRRAEDFFLPWKIRPKASTLPLDHRSRLIKIVGKISKIIFIESWEISKSVNGSLQYAVAWALDQTWRFLYKLKYLNHLRLKVRCYSEIKRSAPTSTNLKLVPKSKLFLPIAMNMKIALDLNFY